jgi:hypothetical protein
MQCLEKKGLKLRNLSVIEYGLELFNAHKKEIKKNKTIKK